MLLWRRSVANLIPACEDRAGNPRRATNLQQAPVHPPPDPPQRDATDATLGPIRAAAPVTDSGIERRDQTPAFPGEEKRDSRACSNRARPAAALDELRASGRHFGDCFIRDGAVRSPSLARLLLQASCSHVQRGRRRCTFQRSYTLVRLRGTRHGAS